MNKESLLQPVKRNWHLLAIYIVMSYVLTQVIVDGSNRIANATDSLFAGEQIELVSLIIPFIILMVIGTVASYITSYTKKLFSVNVQTGIKNMTVKKLVRLQYSYFDTQGTGSILNKLISDVYEIEALFSEVLPEFLMGIVTIVTVGVYILTMDYRLFLVTIICYPLLLWIANILSKMLGKLSGNRRALYDALGNTSMDTFNGMIIGRSYNLNQIMDKRNDDAVNAILKNEYPRTRISSIALVLSNIIRWIPNVACYLFALYEVLNGNMTVGSLLAFAMLLDRIVHPFGEIPGYLNAIREEWVSFKRIDEIIQQPDEVSGTGSFEPVDGEPVIELENIEFSYDGDRKIFDSLNMTIENGKKTALVGSSGGGKSTVFRILCGFYIPQSGNYKLYGHSYDEWDVKELRKQFALVSQNVFLFPDTIAANVSYGSGQTTLDEVKTACRYANIHDFIESLPQGYDTYVGERGVKLSGGQRQRLSIARAFLKRAPILLLDEPTSAVDVETEESIKESLEKISVGKTVITIAHRLSTIENSDKILVFDAGTIVESGTHEELLCSGGLYESLYTKEKQVMDSQLGGEQ